MRKPKSLSNVWIWVSAFVLFICVAATAVVVAGKMETYLYDDSGAIALIPENIPLTTNEEEASSGIASQNTESAEPSTETVSPPTEVQSDDPSETVPPETQPKNPGFEADDDEKVWTTDTQVEIFRVSYRNGEQILTVKSENGDKLIAPGTENSYTFKLKNTGDTALDYSVTVDAYFTPGDVVIPITGRISRYDGVWIAGDKEAYTDVKMLDSAADRATLGAGRYTYYTLDWIWPYESGDDELDTLLGNTAVDQDLIFTIVITTTATENPDPDAGGGLESPQTGDDSHIALWFLLMIVSLAALLFLIFLPKRRKDKDRF